MKILVLGSMSTSTPQEVIVAWFDRVWNKRSKDAIYELMAADGVANQEGGPPLRGPNEFMQFYDALVAAFPDLKLRVIKSVGDAEQAAIHWEATGTHRGELMGIPASQQSVAFSGMSFVRVKDGQITEGWDSWNVGGLMAKLAEKAA